MHRTSTLVIVLQLGLTLRYLGVNSGDSLTVRTNGSFHMEDEAQQVTLLTRCCIFKVLAHWVS